MPESKAEDFMKSVNGVLEQFVPFGASIGIIARMLIPLLKKNGIETAPFEQELARVDAARDNITAAVADFKSKFGTA